MKNFRTFLILAILMTIGCAVMPLIDVTEQPRERQGHKLTISYNWPEASAKVVEQNVTSRLEGLVSAVKGVESTESESRFGSGRIVVNLKPQTIVSSVRFEILSLLRQTFRLLPEGVGYPNLQGGDVITGSKSRQNDVKLLSYRINANMNGIRLQEYVSRVMERALSGDADVRRVEVTGARDKFIEITYNPEQLALHGLTAHDIENGIKAFTGREDIAGMVDDHGENTVMRLATDPFVTPLEEMPIKNIDGKTVYLRDLASFDYRDKLPDSYYRVNGQSTVFLNIYTDPQADKVITSRRLRQVIVNVASELKEGMNLSLDHDAAADAESQLSRLIRRTALALLILLVFVWLVSRSWRYLSVITIALLANILLAALIYWMLDIRLHVYSLAGITVSLGMIIDATVVMADHYGYYRDRRAFIAILAALLTTIGSLIVIFWLPEHIQRDMYDFALIIMVNLTVALVVAYFFTPAMIDSSGYTSARRTAFTRHRRHAVLWKRIYTRYVTATQRHKWIAVATVVMIFGIPFHLLPEKWKSSDILIPEATPAEQAWYARTYDTWIGSPSFQHTWKPWLAKIFGGSWRIFSESMEHNDQHHDDDRPKELHIRAQMPLGGSVHELNDKVMQLETFLTQFDRIKRFETRVAPWGATIDVQFTDSAAVTGFPYLLENKVIGKVISIGGAEWSTSGVSERGFSNSLNLQYRSNRIEITGYNYDRLYRMAEDISRKMASNQRIVDITIETPGHERQEDEFFMVYDQERMALYDFDIMQAHDALSSVLSGRWIGKFDDGHIKADMYMKPAGEDGFKLWHLENAQLRTSDSTQIIFSDFMSISRREAKNVIPKKNQEYILRIAFNVLGSYSYSNKYIKELIESCNASMPVGYRCRNASYGQYEDTGEQYWMLLLVIAVIFLITAILFESISIPLTILSLIPLTFVGTFLTYSVTGIPFGTVGYAALVLLAGLTVNAGIYIIAEFRSQLRHGYPPVKAYVRAYNHKITAVFLTILSTVLGLIPFFIDGKEEPFWFSFAAGTSGGLIFSVIALILLMPICLRLKTPTRNQ